MSEHTILAPNDKGTIKCKACGMEFPRHSPPSRNYVGGRSGWSLLRAHVTKRHPALNAERLAGIAAWNRENSLIVSETFESGEWTGVRRGD